MSLKSLASYILNFSYCENLHFAEFLIIELFGLLLVTLKSILHKDPKKISLNEMCRPNFLTKMFILLGMVRSISDETKTMGDEQFCDGSEYGLQNVVSVFVRE